MTQSTHSILDPSYLVPNLLSFLPFITPVMQYVHLVRLSIPIFLVSCCTHVYALVPSAIPLNNLLSLLQSLANLERLGVLIV